MPVKTRQGSRKVSWRLAWNKNGKDEWDEKNGKDEKNVEVKSVRSY